LKRAGCSAVITFLEGINKVFIYERPCKILFLNSVYAAVKVMSSNKLQTID